MALASYMIPLRDELLNDPLGRGYSGMTDQQAADSLNTANRTREVDSFSGDFMFSRTDSTEFAGLSADKQQLWVSFTSKASIDPWVSNNVEFVKWIFGDSSNTVAKLGDDRIEDITRAQEIGFTKTITAETVANARS